MTIPITFITFILITIGIFDTLSYYLSGVSLYFPIPAEGLDIIAAQFANFVAAQTIAGNLLSMGVLTSKEIVITLLIGDVLSSVMIMLTRLVPLYVGIFGPRIGMEILTLSTTIRTGITLLVISALVMFW